MDCKQIVFVKLSANLPYESKKIIGTILISELKHAIERRQTRNQFCIYVDEFQTFASFEDFSTLITQAPKYGVATTIAHHERHGQLLDDPMILGATAVIANKVLFQLTGRDAADFAPELAEDPPTETRTEPELVICQDPVSDLLRRPHRNAEIRVFVNKYLRPLQERRSDAREDMEGERLIRMDYLDEAAVLGTEERTGTLYGQADFQYRLLEAREAALRQARRQTGIMYDLFDTAKNLRLTLRGLNSFCTDIMEGRQARGQESFSQFLIGLVHNFAGVEEKYRDALELYIALSYGDPKAPRSIPFAFAQKYGLFHTAAAEALRQAEIKRKGEEDKRHGDYIAHWEADTEHRESSRRFRVRDLLPKLQKYDLQFGKFFDLERDLLKPFLFISACPYAQQALAPFLSTRFAGLWKEAYKNWRPSIPRDVLKRLEYLRDDDGRDIYNAPYSTRDKVHFSVGFLDSFRAFFEKYEEGAVVALALVGTAEFPTRWVWDLGGKSGDTGYYPYFNVLYLPDIENRKPWEVLSLLEELTAALSGIKCETDCAKFYESANGANPYTRKKREMRGGYEIETDLDNLVGFGAHAGDLTKLIEDRDELKEIKKAIDLNVWREYLDIGKHKWWDKSSDLMKAYLIARACDIVHFGKEVADFTFPQPDVNGAGDKEVTEFVAALVGMVKQKEKYHEWPKYLPQRVVPGTLDPRVLNGEEAQLVREACMKELQVSDEQIQKVAGTIDEFAKFCGLLGKPENHIKVRSGMARKRTPSSSSSLRQESGVIKTPSI
jgi:hypothetical protein